MIPDALHKVKQCKSIWCTRLHGLPIIILIIAQPSTVLHKEPKTVFHQYTSVAGDSVSRLFFALSVSGFIGILW